MQTVHTVISNIPYPTDLHTIPTIHTIPPFMPYIPYLPYIPNIPYFPNMPNQTDHTHHTYPTYHTTPPPHHGGGGGQYHPHHTTGGEGEDLIWGQYMGPIPWGAGGVAGPGAYIHIWDHMRLSNPKQSYEVIIKVKLIWLRNILVTATAPTVFVTLVWAFSKTGSFFGILDLLSDGSKHHFWLLHLHVWWCHRVSLHVCSPTKQLNGIMAST